MHFGGVLIKKTYKILVFKKYHKNCSIIVLHPFRVYNEDKYT